MAKIQGATLQTTENTDTTNSMLTTTNTQVHSAKVVLENPNGTSHRLVYYNHEGWQPEIDLSLTDLIQASAGLEAIGKMVAGGYIGNPNLFLVAPEEKVLFENGTGTMAYVANTYRRGKDDLTVEIGGKKIVLFVDPQDVPDTLGYRRLHLVKGQLYSKNIEPTYGPRDKDPWTFWNCTAVSAILGGSNVSVSVGPRTMQRAQDILGVANAENPTEAYDTHLWAGRESSRVQRSANAHLADYTRQAQETGQAVQVGAGDLDIPLRGGGTISLSRYDKATPIHVATAAGLNLSDRFLKDDTDAARLAMAASLREFNLVIVLR